MSRYIDAEYIEYEPMLSPRGNGMYEEREIAYKDEIDDIPTADVRENVRGEWIEKYYASNETGETVFHGMIMCSVCGHVPKVGWLSNYCPNCGAQMMRGEL